MHILFIEREYNKYTVFILSFQYKVPQRYESRIYIDCTPKDKKCTKFTHIGTCFVYYHKSSKLTNKSPASPINENI